MTVASTRPVGPAGPQGIQGPPGTGSVAFGSGLTSDGTTLTADIATGKAGGQTATGGTAASDSLTLRSTSNAAKGKLIFDASANWDETNKILTLAGTIPRIRLYDDQATPVLQCSLGRASATNDIVGGSLINDLVLTAVNGGVYIKGQGSRGVVLHSVNDLAKLTVDESNGISLNFNGSGVLSVDNNGVNLGGNAPHILLNTGGGSKIGTTASQKMGLWGATPIIQQVLATGAGHTADDIITFLQLWGACRQA